MVEALGSTQAGRAHTDDENIDVAIEVKIVSQCFLGSEPRAAGNRQCPDGETGASGSWTTYTSAIVKAC